MHLSNLHQIHEFCLPIATVCKTNEIINILIFPKALGCQSLVRRWRFEACFIKQTSITISCPDAIFLILDAVFWTVSIKSSSGSTILCKNHYKTLVIFETQITRVAVTMVNVANSDFMNCFTCESNVLLYFCILSEQVLLIKAMIV